MNRKISKQTYFFVTKAEKFLYEVVFLQEGMFLFASKIGKEIYLINENEKTGYMLVDIHNIVQVSENEIDFYSIQKRFAKESINEDPKECIKYNLYFEFRLTEFKNGRSQWFWEIFPDGRYFEEDDGTGMRPNNPVIISSTISSDGVILKPFSV